MENRKRKVCILSLNRAEYSRLYTVIRELQKKENIELQTVVLQTRYSNSRSLFERDGLPITKEFHVDMKERTPTEVSKLIGKALVEFTNIFTELKPDILIVLGDRYESLAAVAAATYLNIFMVHIQGGEVSGTIDEHTRHAITKFCHFHLPATEQSKTRIIKMGELSDNVVCVGCPGTDLLLETPKISFEDLRYQLYKLSGQRDFLEKLIPGYILVVQFPMTTELNDVKSHIDETLSALKDIKRPIVILKPNPDAGGDIVSECIENFKRENKNVLVAKHFPPHLFVNLMRQASVMVGNSSAGIRETGYFGLPTINIGNRQVGRERTANIIDVPNDAKLIREEIERQIEHGRYETESVYGDGTACLKIAEIISSLDYSQIQKRITY